LGSLPDRLGDLTALTSLDVSGNRLGSLPDRLGDLTALTSLDVSSNRLGSLPDRLGDLTALTSLDVSRNQLGSLPDRLGDLTALTSLDVSGNQLGSLPDRLGDLTTLTSLTVSGNQLGSLPDRLGDLTALTSLTVSGNQLGSLPDRLGDLTTLTSLDISFNQLGSLPDRLFDLTALTSLNVSGNQLGSLPDRLGDLTALTHLTVSGNQLGSLPDRLFDLTALTSLTVSGNQLGSLPDRLGDLTALTHLTDPPLKTVEAGLDPVRRYLEAKRRRESGGTWVVWSSLDSFILGLNSRLALAETVICVLALLVALHSGFVWPLLSGAAIAPLLLMKREESIQAGVDRFARLATALGLSGGKGQPGGPVRGLSLFVRLLVLGIGSLIIKVVTAAQFAFSWKSIEAIPENFQRQMLVIDLFSPPELVPGVEEAYGRYRDSVFTPRDLLRDFTDRENLGFVSRRFISRNPPVSTAGLIALGPLFLIAWLYRFSLKASCLLYWPFLLVHRVDEDRLKELAAETTASDVLKNSPVNASMLGIGGLALYALSVASGAVGIAGWIEARMPEALKELLAAGAGIAAPKLFFTALLAMAAFYFVTVFWRWAMARAYKAADGPERGDFKFYLRAFQVFAFLQNAAISVATGYTFVWAWPLFIRKVPEVVAFLF
ncbi:MAG: leucine-rich repeat domain-containing protein, partial [Nisaea sp.]